ncbi:hypothetical protein TSAR_016139 [Trichomalopsis sarcophagae]|uniref:Uncharacterized protein n=1 Tax=Trichomalopsis sarcophagae TaxID=543379 RepID=A0A232FHZ6_9HYME|nr:hypothetical protein TSAR_016139 [Trichomalopsis sarcophagae]
MPPAVLCPNMADTRPKKAGTAHWYMLIGNCTDASLSLPDDSLRH